ncbi:MAG: P-loop NTPase fold protein [Ignavibacteria bacterium]
MVCLISEEIRQLFMLIKSIADFPFTTYILAFDKDVVSKSLTETFKVDGRVRL